MFLGEVSFDAARVSGDPHIAAGNLIIEGAANSIGSRARPIAVDLTGKLTVRSEDDAFLMSAANAEQPLLLESAIVDGVFELTTAGAILDGNDTTDSQGNQIVPVTNVIGGDDVLFNADTVGTEGNPVEVEINGLGALGGNITTSMHAFGPDSLVVGDLNSSAGTLVVTSENNLLLGLTTSEHGHVVFESLSGSILNEFPNALNILANDVQLTGQRPCCHDWNLGKPD